MTPTTRARNKEVIKLCQSERSRRPFLVMVGVITNHMSNDNGMILTAAACAALGGDYNNAHQSYEWINAAASFMEDKQEVIKLCQSELVEDPF